MHILWLILKIIGIVLLVLVILFLVLLLLFLFAPVTYRAEGKYAGEKIYGRLRLHYLFPILTAYLCYDGKPEGKVKVLGITVYDFFAPQKPKKEKKAKKPKPPKKEKSPQSTRNMQTKGQENTSPVQLEATAEPKAEQKIEQTETISDVNKSADTQTLILTQILPNNKESKENIFQKLSSKIKAFICRIKQILTSLAEMFKRWKKGIFRLKKTVKGLLETLQSYLALWEREETQRAFAKAKKTIGRLLKGIRPRKGKLHLHFGTDDPGTTGEICAFLGMIYPFVGNYVMIEPDFEKTVFELDFHFKGHITVFMLLRAGWVYLFDKDLKAFKEVWAQRERN